MAWQKSENRIVPKASGNRGRTWVVGKAEGGKAVPVKVKGRQLELLFAAAESPWKGGAESRKDGDRTPTRLKKARKAKRKPLNVGPAGMEEVIKCLEIAFVNVAANQGASLRNYPPFSWPGGSMVVDYDGRVLAQAEPGPGERIVVAEVDLGALRAARQQRLLHNPLAHLRQSVYRVRPEVGYRRGPLEQGRTAKESGR